MEVNKILKWAAADVHLSNFEVTRLIGHNPIIPFHFSRLDQMLKYFKRFSIFFMKKKKLLFFRCLKIPFAFS